MYTIVQCGNWENNQVVKIYGLSTDEKPLSLKEENAKLSNASSFYEMDTQKVFLYDEENKRWLEQ